MAYIIMDLQIVLAHILHLHLGHGWGLIHVHVGGYLPHIWYTGLTPGIDERHQLLNPLLPPTFPPLLMVGINSTY